MADQQMHWGRGGKGEMVVSARNTRATNDVREVGMG